MICENLSVLTQFGWVCKEAETKNSFVVLPEPQQGRSSGLPDLLSNLIISYELLANNNDTAWFITYNILQSQSENSFSWNEFEKESLNSAISQNDIEKVNKFWDSHFCFFMSVKSGYAHISIVTSGDKKGQIVWGEEPEYEEVSFLARTYNEFCSILIEHVSGVKKNEILDIIL